MLKETPENIHKDILEDTPKAKIKEMLKSKVRVEIFP